METTARSSTTRRSAEHDAKRPLSAVAGPYGHPFHPILVTVPIGAWIASLVFDIASRVHSGGSITAVDASYWLIGLGIVGAVAAAVFGLMDLLTIPRGTRAFKAGLTHMGLNVLILAMFVANFLWRHADTHLVAKVPAGELALSAVAVALLGASGFIGGTLSYRYGVRVADESTQADGFRR